MKKFLCFLTISMIGLSSYAQTPSACFSSGNDVSFFKGHSNSWGITQGDFDNDGNLDIVTTSSTNSYNQKVSFVQGLGNGKFGSQTIRTSGKANYYLESLDLDNDGNLDLVTTNNAGITIFLGQGNGSFDSLTTYPITSSKFVSIGDVDEDGHPDIVASTGIGFRILLANSGAPETFNLVGTTYNISGMLTNIRLGDMNGDGHLDVISTGSLGIGISLNNPSTLGTFSTGINYTAGTNPFSLAVIDIDHDGDLDVVNSNKDENTISVLTNDGNAILGTPTFYSTELSPEGVRNYDLNNDGNQDIVVVNAISNSMSVFFGSSSGVFTLDHTSQCPGSPRNLVIGNFNSDTHPDIVTLGYTASYVNSYLGNTSSNYTLPDIYSTNDYPRGTDANDFNNDGNKDIVFTNANSNSFGIYLGNGSGSFSPGASNSTGSNPVSIISGDLNNDGNMDVVTADSASNQVSVYFGTGTGTFTFSGSYPAGNGPTSVQVGHLNTDAFLDIAVVNTSSNTISVLLSSSGTSFSAPVTTSVGSSPKDLGIFDRDNDGDNDIVVANSASNNISRLANDGSGNFTLTSNINTVTNPVALDCGDFDGDSDIDIVVISGATYGIARLYNSGGNFFSSTYTSNGNNQGRDIKLIDANNDGKLDVISLFANGSSTNGVTCLFMANSGNNLAFNYSTYAQINFATEVSPIGIATADFNNDNRIDISITNSLNDQINIHWNTTPLITAGGPTTFCNGSSVDLTSTQALWYDWQSNGATTQINNVTSAGTYYVTTSSSWSDWCTSSSNSITTTVTPGPSAPTISVGGSTTICEGSSVTLTSSETSGNQWYKDGVAITGETAQTYTATTSGSYTVTVTTGGCTSNESTPVVVTASETPVITANGPTSFCGGGSVVLTSSVGSNITWSTSETTQSITVTSAGSYSVTNNVSGCPPLTSNTITVTIASSLTAPSITPAGPVSICSGNTVTLTSSSASNNIWSTGETTQTITVSSSGSYSVHLDNGTCTSPASNMVSVTVTPNPSAPTISAGEPTTFCTGNSVTLTSSAASGNTWSTGETTQAITVTTSGTYTVTVSNGSCTATSLPTTITVNPLPATPTITAGGPTTFCDGGSVTLSAPSSTGYLWSTGETTQTITVTTSGSYTVQVSDANGCNSAASAAVNVTVNPIPATPTITAGGATTFCNGGSVTLTSSAASGNTWSTTETTSSISVTTSGSYTVTETQLGCTSPASAPITVTVNPLPATPTITAGSATTFCDGGSVILSAPSSTGYLWSTGETTQTITVTTSGSYTAQVSDANGCFSAASNSITVTVNPLPATPTITASGATTFCNGGSVTLSAPSSSSYNWSSGETTQDITVTASGSFTVNVTDANGCTSANSTAVSVTVNPLPATPTITAGGAITFCDGGSVTLSAPSSTGYLWSTGETTQTITVTTSGSYTAQVSDANGCFSAASNSISVTVNPLPATPTITTSGTTTFCDGGSVTLSAPSSTGYLWSSGETTQTIMVTTSGSYTAQVSDANGCFSAASNSITVTVNPLPATPTITASGATTFCDGGSVTLSAPSSTGYLWSTGETTQTITVTTSGSYTAQISDANGCFSAASNSIAVTVNPLPATPTITAGSTTTFCNGGSVTLSAPSSNGYLWSTGETTQTITVTTSGSYTAQVSDANGCFSAASNSISVTVNPLPATPTITASGATTFCDGGSVTLSAPSSTGYLWSSGETTQDITVTTSGSYTVQISDANGCTSANSAAVSVTVNPLPAAPTISNSSSTFFCLGHTVTLTSSSGAGYLWSTGETTQSIVVGTTGSFTVQVYSAAGCLSNPSAVKNTTAFPFGGTPTVTASGPTTFCDGGSVTLTSSSGTNYLWSTGETTQSIVVTTSGNYSVQIQSGGGCLSNPSTDVTVTVNPLPSAPTITAGGTTTFCNGNDVTLSAPASNGYLWSNGETTQDVIITTSGSYTAQISDANGCFSPASNAIDVTVNPIPPTPTISTSGAITFCDGGSVTLTSSATSGNTWSTTETTQDITVTTSGSFTVTETQLGCTSPASTPITVTVNPLPATPTITAGGPTTFCDGGSVTLSAPSSTGYLWSTGETIQTITVTTSGSYTVQVSDANGCNSATSAAVNVTVNPIPATPTITAGGATTFCNGGSVTLTSSAASGNTWSTTETTSSISVTTSGSYTVTETQLGCTSPASAPITVTVNPLPATPTITAGSATTFCDGGSVILSAPSSTGYLWSTGETTQTITVTTSGSYTAQVSDANGCFSAASNSITVTVNPLPATPTITASGATTFCNGGSVTLSAPSSSSYIWSSGETTQDITVTASGSFTVNVTDANGCTSANSTAVSVTVNPLPATPTITAGGAITFCDGGFVTLSAPSSTGYLWSTGETTQTITVTTSGSYTAQVSDANGCFSAASNSISVTVNPLPATPTITTSGTTTFCDGGSVTLSAPSSTGYLWSTGETTQTITVTTSGSYTAQVSDANGCFSAASTATTITVNPIPPTPVITAGGATTICNGSSVVLTSSATSGNTWSTSATTASISVTTSGTYTVTETQLGCTSPSSAPITITVNPIPAAPTVSAGGPTTFCDGGSVVLTSSVSTGNTWSTGETTQTITVTTSGSYSVTQTVSGCTSPSSAPITVTANPIPAVPTITASGPTTFCAGGSVVLTSSSATNNLWSNGATTQSITVSNSGTFVVQVITNGCTSGASAPQNVTVNALPATPTITNGASVAICQGSSVTLNSSATSGNTWSTGATTPSISVSTSGSYTVTVTDGNGCTSNPSSPTTVTVNNLPAAPVITASGPTTFCSGGQTTLNSSYNFNNLWSSGSTANSITVNNGGSYTVTHTDVNGCVSPASNPVVITVNPNPPAPVITAGGPTTFCAGGSVVLSSDQSSGNSWSSGQMTQTVTVTASGVFSVIYIDANGCASPSSAPVSVTVNANPPAPSITAGGATTFCQGNMVTLTSSYTSGNTWSTGGVTQSINASTSGSYTVTYTNANGCSSTSAATTVTVIPTSNIPTISASGPTTFCDGGDVILTSSDPNSTWSTGATTPSITVTTSGSYTVVGNQTGCPSQSSAAVSVTVNPSPAVPTITPSGPTTICADEELYLFSSGTGTNTWSTGTIGPVIQATVSGNYSVTVSNSFGCTATSQDVPVVINPLPVVTLDPLNSICTYTPPFVMSNGQPSGGTYTGNGISSNVFYPAQVGAGVSIVNYTFTDQNGCSASAVDAIEVNNCAGIKEYEKFYALYPNPTSGVFQIVATNAPIDQVAIYDAQGKLTRLETFNGNSSVTFDLSDYATGVYYLEIKSDTYIERTPLIINH